jgi:hypothetical protein
MHVSRVILTGQAETTKSGRHLQPGAKKSAIADIKLNPKLCIIASRLTWRTSRALREKAFDP